MTTHKPAASSSVTLVARAGFTMSIAMIALSIGSAMVDATQLVPSPFELLSRLPSLGSPLATPANGTLGPTVATVAATLPASKVLKPAALSIIHAVPLCFMLATFFVAVAGLFSELRRVRVASAAQHLLVGVGLGLVVPILAMAAIPQDFAPLNRPPLELVGAGGLAGGLLLAGTLVFKGGASSLAAWSIAALMSETTISYALAQRTPQHDRIDWVYLGMSMFLFIVMALMLTPVASSTRKTNG